MRIWYPKNNKAINGAGLMIIYTVELQLGEPQTRYGVNISIQLHVRSEPNTQERWLGAFMILWDVPLIGVIKLKALPD